MDGKRVKQTEERSKEKRRSSKRKKWKALGMQQKILRILVAILAVLMVIVIGVVAWWKLIFIERLQVNVPDENEIGGVGDPVRTHGDREDDFFTFLVIGRDTGGGGNTDTILLAAYDIKNQELNVMSIPRDTMVNVSWDVKKINSVYNVYGGGDAGIEALGKEVSQLVGFIPDYQVVMEWEAVGQLVDALGGVYYDVPKNMNYTDPTQNLVISIKKGYQRIDGNLAMQLVRYRGYATGDLGRIETQQDFLKAVIDQCLKISNVTRINELAKVFTENVTTNLSIKQLAWLADQAIFGGLSMDNVNFYTMPCKNANLWSRSYGAYLSYVVPVTDELVDLVNEKFNPFVDDLEAHELDIMYVNSDGTIGSSTGVVEDSKANASLPSRNNSGSSNSNAGENSGNEEPDPSEGTQGGDAPDETEDTPEPETPDEIEGTEPDDPDQEGTPEEAPPDEGESEEPVGQDEPEPAGQGEPEASSPEGGDASGTASDPIEKNDEIRASLPGEGEGEVA